MSKTRPILTLTTDFGTKEAYVSAMKGVIYGIYPHITLVDISHNIVRHNILQGAFVVAQASQYFPVGTIHLIVIDPGVGTSRRRIIVQSKRGLYVCPDNGVLSFIFEQEGFVQAVEITNERYMLPNPSRTFEGRDVFAPVAAYLAKGISLDEFGPSVENLVKIVREAPVKTDGGILGNIIHIDGFGNIITNIPPNYLRDRSLAKKLRSL
ncbi:MAG: SAM-dependent chlorinase/fluorinase [Candidatus Bathyarchaeota archaeon]|nr:MAG: SAM-dependent chlorinase/fluorinase [Candidatus Bathyarchaeota archaeon]